MNAVIFAGPTLTAADIRQELEAIVLPPAAQGDVLAVARQRPKAIGIIDGYFDQVPSIWHKEILWAMKEGIYVFGAASMGALRAVELAPFGMIGVGEIFRAFLEGELEDDDEVALCHGPAEDGFRPLSEAMVNIRATLRSAGREGVLTGADVAKLEALAKQLPYPERSYPRILARAAGAGVAQEELGRLESWLPRGAVDQKRRDALDLLRAMRSLVEADAPSQKVDYTFEHTEAWEGLFSQQTARSESLASGVEQGLLEEVQLSGDHAALMGAAVARALALALGRRFGGRADFAAAQSSVARFRQEHQLLDQAAFRSWLDSAELGADRIESFFRDRADAYRAASLFEPEIVSGLADSLREQGRYRELTHRGREKRKLLADLHLESPSLADLGLEGSELWRWYFGTVLKQETPLDLEGFARARGFPDLESLQAAVAREWIFQTRGGGTLGGWPG